MDMRNTFIWYQKKIGTYDKQKWETKIEQREQRISGLTHIQTRSTKPNTDLIDLDLVRGSSFTKAKPQHGFIKVVKLATLRCIFYPFYGKWWIDQVSYYVYVIGLFVYISHILNTVIYFGCIPINNEMTSCMEVLVPFLMVWILSLIHSQIVATTPGFKSKNLKIKQKQYKKKRASIKINHKVRDSISIPQSTTHDEEKGDIKQQATILGKETLETNKYMQNRISTNLTRDGSQLTGEGGFQVVTDMDHKCKQIKCESLDMRIGFHIPLMEMNSEKLDNQLHKQGLCNNTDSDSETSSPFKSNKRRPLVSRRNMHIPTVNVTSNVESLDDSEDAMLSSPDKKASCQLLGEMSLATEWIGITTNSEEYSYSSDIDNISDNNIEHDTDCMSFESDLAPTAILNPPSFKVSCIIWERNEIKKADLSMLDISSVIIRRVDAMPEIMDYFYIGIVLSTILATLPAICRICNKSTDIKLLEVENIIKDMFRNITSTRNGMFICETYEQFVMQISVVVMKCLNSMVGENIWESIVMVIALLERWILGCMVFFLLCVAERTFKQRLLYAKLFSHLTSSRRARKSELPHFRLNKVRNIKIWLSVRSYLKKRGPQRSVDVIVSTAFIVNLLLLIFLCVELLKDTVLFSQYYLEALIWCLGLGTFLLRFMTLGTKINKKYRNLSVLITEQINLHLQLEQKPHKKDEYTTANNVLKLAIDLLKELENPFKISGLSANPLLYNVTKLVILSALSGVLSEILGFKLKLHKIKLK